MTQPENSQAKLLEELTPLAGSDATLQRMLKTNRPLTKETWMAMNWPEGAPKMTAELEQQIPEPLRRSTSSAQPSETEADGIRAEARRRLQVRQLSKAHQGRTRGSSK